jgi:hypothetical protein
MEHRIVVDLSALTIGNNVKCRWCCVDHMAMRIRFSGSILHLGSAEHIVTEGAAQIFGSSKINMPPTKQDRSSASIAASRRRPGA